MIPRTSWQPTLFACANQLFHYDTAYPLVEASAFSQYLQCKYAVNTGQGRVQVPGAYCWYDYRNHTLYNYPSTPMPLDSSPSCPETMPFAQNYAIKADVSDKCVTASSETSGSAIMLMVCNGNPLQKWFFNGSNMQLVGTNKCMDVKNGFANGAKLQVWDCVPGNSNQQFQHWVHEFLIVPEDHILWMTNPGKCLDNSNGNIASGNPIQIWDCFYLNPNQVSPSF
ncbi:carbohydrate-binding module family 13 protein [Sphaerobolus stellatus SS14]|nr:carbohydrate-binding module family 13 protein [Sphaerobolus stellatus SS14]